MKTSIKTIGLLSALAMGLTSPLFSQVPDLTKDTQSVDRNETYNLGATGLRGWIYNWEASNHERAQGRTTQASRQILVTHVGAASPADGVVKVDDVILGVDGKPFSDDARKSIALAIQEAETKALDGVLKLTVWRAGQTQDLSLKLVVMGTYSDTAPYKCDESKLILENAIKVLEKEKMEPNWAGSIQGLALLATGKPEYLPKLRDFAHRLSKPGVDPDMKPAYGQAGKDSGPLVGDFQEPAVSSCLAGQIFWRKETLRAIVEFLRKAGTQEEIEFQYLTGRKRPHRQLTCVQLPNSCLVAVFPAFLLSSFSPLCSPSICPDLLERRKP